LLLLGLLLALPYIILIEIVILVLIINVVIQKLTEVYILQRARMKLEKHPGLKIAIAGSYGKTTMREILKTVLDQGKGGKILVSAPEHNYNTPIGISRFINNLTGNEDILIFELGEYYPGDISKLCKLVRPDIGIITGINEAHLEKFKTLERTTKTIFELADSNGLKSLYVNAENELCKKSARTGNIQYDRSGIDSLSVVSSGTGLQGTIFTVLINGQKVEFKSGLLGFHQVGPLLVAIHIALKQGLSIDEIQQGIIKTKAFEHRLQIREDSSGVTTIDDSYNGNPDGVRAVIYFLASIKNTIRWYVTPGLVEVGDRTEIVHKKIGEQLAFAKIEKIVLIKNSVTQYIAEGLQDAKYTGEIIWFDDALSAFKALSHLTVKGDIVLLQNDWPDQYA